MKKFKKNICVDASNIVSGGGLTHLINFLEHYKKKNYHKKINLYLYCNYHIYYKIKLKDIVKVNIGKLSSDYIFFRFFWLLFKLPKLLNKHSCNTLFAIGGFAFIRHNKIILMHRNMQPFQLQKNTLYGISLKSAKVLLKRFFSLISLKRAKQVIFLSNNGFKVCKKLTKFNFKKIIINHGTVFKKNLTFSYENLPKKKISFIYPSSIEVYKNHDNLIKAFYQLRKKLNVTLTIIGHVTDKKSFQKIMDLKKKLDPNGEFIIIKENIPNKDLIKLFSKFDIGIHASSCENFPNTLVEMLSQGLPTVTSEIPVMKEVLGKSYIYFNEQNISDIEKKLSIFLNDKRWVDYLNKRRHFFKKNYDLSNQQNKIFDILV